MKAIVYAQHGGPEVLRLEDVEEPHAGPGQVRLKVMAAGVNPVDYKIRNGWMPDTAPTSDGAANLIGVSECDHSRHTGRCLAR